MAIIPLVQPLPIGSSDLPGGFGRAALLTPPYLVLHREEFAWPRMSPCAPVRSYFLKFEISNLKLALAGRTVSPITWFESEISIRSLKSNRAGLFSVALVVARRNQKPAARISSGAPLLAGSLPCGVRTFLSFGEIPKRDFRPKQRSPDLLSLQGRSIIT